MATAAGTPALAMFAISSRRVIATSVLFLIRGLGRLSATGFDSLSTSLLTALETLRVDVGSAAQRPRHRAYQGRACYRNSTDGTENRRVGIGWSCQVNGNRFESAHFPNHAFFRATHAGNSGPDRPTIRNLIELACGTGGMSNWPLAAHLVKAPALAVAFVAERSGKSAGIKVRAPRTIFVNHSLVRELRTANVVQLRQFAHGDVFQNHAQQVVRIGRAPGEVDDRLAGDDGI